MKKVFCGIVAMLCLVSCSTVRKSATTMDVVSSLNSATKADLVVLQNKATLEDYVPTKKEKRGGNQNVKNVAVAKLLKQNGNADVLIEPQFEIVMKRRTIKRITVTGYPATYKNFRQN